jgi:hypothetical protein
MTAWGSKPYQSLPPIKAMSQRELELKGMDGDIHRSRDRFHSLGRRT